MPQPVWSDGECEPAGVEHRGVDVAAGDGIAEAEQRVAPCGVACQSLWCGVDEGVEIYLSAVGGPGSELEIQLIVGNGAVFDDHLVDDPLDRLPDGLVAEYRDEPVGAATDVLEPVVGSEADAGTVEGLQIRRVQGADHLLAHHPIRGDELHLRPGGGEALRGPQRLVAAPDRCRRGVIGLMTGSPRSGAPEGTIKTEWHSLSRHGHPRLAGKDASRKAQVMATHSPETPSRSDQPSRWEGAGTRVHKTINRWLATVALVLSIVVLAAIIIGGIRLATAANEIGDRLGELGSGSGLSDTPVSPDSFDPSGGVGPGLNEDGTPYVQPDDADPGSYVGPLNPDGTPCVGYGCTPEQDAELDAGMDDGSVGGDLEQRCADGTATVEECFGPGSDLNDNGIADINE
jgi:hypothetical protein